MSQPKQVKDSVPIIFIGISKVGKTSLAKIFANEEVPEDYTPTSGETKYIAEYEIGKKTYKFSFYDTNGSDLINNRGTVSTYFKKSKIHFIVASRELSDSVEYFEGVFKSLGSDSDSDPYYKVAFLTHSDLPDDDGLVDQCKGFVPEGNPLFEVNCLQDAESIRGKFVDFMKKVYEEHKELFDGAEVKGGKKKTNRWEGVETADWDNLGPMGREDIKNEQPQVNKKNNNNNNNNKQKEKFFCLLKAWQ